MILFSVHICEIGHSAFRTCDREENISVAACLDRLRGCV